MMLHALVESNTAAILLVKTLNEEQANGSVEIRASGPLSSLYAAARTLLAVRFEPVALVLDAGSTDPEAERRRRDEADEVIGEASGAAPLRVLVAVPALEALLFLRPGAVMRAFGPTDEDLLELGRLSPRDALKKLEPNGSEYSAAFRLVQALDDVDVAALRDMPPIRELLELLEELRRCGMLATAAASS
jgi:hypothetical protein